MYRRAGAVRRIMPVMSSAQRKTPGRKTLQKENKHLLRRVHTVQPGSLASLLGHRSLYCISQFTRFRTLTRRLLLRHRKGGKKVFKGKRRVLWAAVVQKVDAVEQRRTLSLARGSRGMGINAHYSSRGWDGQQCAQCRRLRILEPSSGPCGKKRSSRKHLDACMKRQRHGHSRTRLTVTAVTLNAAVHLLYRDAAVMRLL